MSLLSVEDERHTCTSARSRSLIISSLGSVLAQVCCRTARPTHTEHFAVVVKLQWSIETCYSQRCIVYNSIQRALPRPERRGARHHDHDPAPHMPRAHLACKPCTHCISTHRARTDVLRPQISRIRHALRNRPDQTPLQNSPEPLPAHYTSRKPPPSPRSMRRRGGQPVYSSLPVAQRSAEQRAAALVLSTARKRSPVCTTNVAHASDAVSRLLNHSSRYGWRTITVALGSNSPRHSSGRQRKMHGPAHVSDV